MSKNARDMRLSPSDTVDDAFARIAAWCRDQLTQNLEEIDRTEDAEAVHQARVALRRLDTAAAAFRDAIVWPKDDPLRRELNWLKGELGRIRDADVLALETLPALASSANGQAKPLGDAVAALRRARRADGLASIRSERCRRLLDGLDGWIAASDWRGDGREALSRPVTELAGDALRRLHRKVWKDGADLRDMSAKRRHRTRLRLKRLRYASEIFESLYDSDRSGAYLSRLKKAQDRLGASNDLEVARALIVEATDGAPKPLRKAGQQLVDRWRSAHAKSALKAGAKSFRKLYDTEAFWRGAVRVGDVAPPAASPTADAAAPETPDDRPRSEA